MRRFEKTLTGVLTALLVSGCGPMLASNTSAGNCAKPAVSFGADSFPQGQQRISATQSVAQSFVLNPGGTVSGVSLRLTGFSPTTPSSLFGTLNVFIVPDVSGGATPSQPNCSPANASITCADQAVLSGSLNLNTVTLNVPKYYNIPLAGASDFLKKANQPKAYWVVVAASYQAGSTSYVSWDGSVNSAPTSTTGTLAGRTGTSTPQLGALTTTNTFFNSNWNASGQNMTFQVCR